MTRSSSQLRDVLEKRQPFRWYGPGSQPPMKVLTFERELAARMQTRYALAVTSGTAALTTALAALGVGPGDEVILPALSWYSCFNSIVMQGALPVFAESDESLNIDPADIESKITPQTKVIMVVHALGNPADMDAIMAIARRRGIKVLEDCAQSVGGSYKGKPLGSIGDIGIYSFQLSKTISSGEGGGVVTSDPLLFERASRYHDLGLLRPPHEQMLGRRRDSGNDRQPVPHERVYRRRAPGTDPQTRHDHRLPCAATPAQCSRGSPTCPTCTCATGRIPGRYRHGHLARFSIGAKRDKFLAAMRAENVPATAPSAVVLVPLHPSVEQKLTIHPNWPSFASERGRSIRYGAECCPKTIAIQHRFAGITLDPKYARRDLDDIVAAIRKVFPSVVRDS